MLKRIYIHNYKAFQNFELKFDDFGSSLFLGKNGSGKSSLVEVFKIFQAIGDGTTQLGELIKKDSFNVVQSNQPIQLELDVICDEKLISYQLTIDFPNDFYNPRVREEKLLVENICILERSLSDVRYHDFRKREIADFSLDWHMLALPIFNPRKQEFEFFQYFKNWLKEIVVLSPIPAFMGAVNNKNANKPDYYAGNICIWITHLFSNKPKSYQYIDEYLKPIFPDLEEVSNEDQELKFIFRIENQQKVLKYSQLSYGERIFVLWSAILASVKLDQISLCVWDEPENYISLLEIQHYFNTLKQTFNDKAQFVATTHNPETMRMFSSEDIFILFRKHHLEPVRLQAVADLNIENDIAEMIKAGLVEL